MTRQLDVHCRPFNPPKVASEKGRQTAAYSNAQHAAKHSSPSSARTASSLLERIFKFKERACASKVELFMFNDSQTMDGNG